jgi:hypothetical protein
MPKKFDDLLDRLRESATEARVQYPCVEKETIAIAESDLGFRMPHLLRAVYMTVANGGFGPGFGLIGLENGAHMRMGRTSSNFTSNLKHLHLTAIARKRNFGPTSC